MRCRRPGQKAGRRRPLMDGLALCPRAPAAAAGGERAALRGHPMRSSHFSHMVCVGGGGHELNGGGDPARPQNAPKNAAGLLTARLQADVEIPG